MLHTAVTAAGAKIHYEESMEQILARDEVGKKITKEWGVLK